ncbi:ComEA family DNA-binding protein [Aquisalimonas asiatica]|uniref:Competence protein ComEA n=1 Tax=Aquisalimonas asiatica TaxID=406100 RepID=A0A1H8RU16_9GAMM|nr:ComEA family DNA-binding protein [Aquisalimonas asiatica]SEO69658.1 competence protein ComEA [Aquisalimonas asiatica]
MSKSRRAVRFAPAVAMLFAASAFAGPVDLNTADAETLAAELDGVGESRAAAIVEYREANGGFDSVDALTNVQGVGAATLESNRERLTVDVD